MPDYKEPLRTYVSQSFWCDYSKDGARFEKAKICFGPCKHINESPRRCAKSNKPSCGNGHATAWFDQLFRGGIRFPDVSSEAGSTVSKPLTVLVAGPPGTGKTTLCSEICYNLAECENVFSLYVSTESETNALISNFASFGHENPRRFVRLDPEYSRNEGEAQVYVWGKERVDRVNQTNGAIDIVESAIKDITSYLSGIDPGVIKILLDKMRPKQLKADMLSPGVVVFDSLNVIPPNDAGKFINSVIALAQEKKTGILFLVLDSSIDNREYKIWEHACDIVIRLDYTNKSGYYTRTIEVVKARYQSHIWGEHPFKIYRAYNAGDDSETMRRAHPYRTQGGIFIYPSIHYYLSEYRYKGPPAEREMCETLPKALNRILTRPSAEQGGRTPQGGFPRGRCTAFIGGRGAHKSHLAYLHLLSRMLDLEENERETRATERTGANARKKERRTHRRTDPHEEGSLIISLRDDEHMTRSTMNSILKGFGSHERVPDNVSAFEKEGRFEILYFHPGYTTPQEVFHRIFIAVQRVKRKCRKVTVLFNSLDQLAARFPLCAREEMFIPGIINFLTGEQMTSIFIAVTEEKGQPSEQYALLPMADLILSFNRKRINTYSYLEAVRTEHPPATDGEKTAFEERAAKLTRKQKEYVEEVVVEVVRFSGGQRAGACGILELVNEVTEDCIYDRPGLHFSPLSVGGWEYIPKTKVAAPSLGVPGNP